MTDSEKFMHRACYLANLASGFTSPNPLVGCVIVKNGEIIGEGWHKQHGGPHAEVNAVNSLKNKSDIKNSDVYVSLEPCSHYGKTPPCADLLIKYNPKNVYIACLDPFPEVSGRGIQKLKNAGINVETGIGQKRAEFINRRFLFAQRNKKSYFILKWAHTADGFIARKDFSSKWISSKVSRTWVHKMRAEEDGILVGYNTAKHDNPSLNVRDWSGKNPVRIVIDPKLELPKDLKIYSGNQKTLIINEIKEGKEDHCTFMKVSNSKNWEEIRTRLFKIGLLSIVVEGGSTTLKQIIEAEEYNEIRLFKSLVYFKEGIDSPKADYQKLQSLSISDDQFYYYLNG